MKITPRGVEVKAIAALLESGEYDSPEALAKAVIKKTAELMSDREMFAWVYREVPDAPYFCWGPFSSEVDAKKFAGKYVSALKGQHMILPLSPPNELDARMATYKIPSQFCATCPHSLVSHEHPKIQPKCAVRGCKCKKATIE